MDEYGIVKTTTWQGWCTATGLQNKDSYSEQEIAQFYQILKILRNAEKFNEKPTILIPNLPTYLGSIVIALVIGAIAGFFFGVIFTVTVKSTRTSYLLDKPVQLYVAQQIKRN